MLKLLKPITAINGFRIGDKVRLKDGDGRPHIIKAVVIDGLKEFFFVVQFEDGTETMLDNISPLPSDLDEAAEEYGRKEYSHAIHFWDEGLSKNKPEVMKKDFVDSFKAGAEWMAGQFQKIEGELVDWYSTSDGKDYCCGVRSKDAFEVPEGFYIKKKEIVL